MANPERRHVLDSLYFNGKPVAPLGERLYVISSVRGDAQLFSQDGNIR